MTKQRPHWLPTIGRRLIWPALVSLFFVATTIWIFWPLPARMARVVVSRADPLHQLWTLRWTQHALFTDPAKLFAANVNYPYDAALTLNQPTYTNALLTAPVYALSHNPALTLNSGVLLAYILGGIFTALLVQQLTGNRWAALAAGVIYTFSPVRQAHIYHLNLISGYWTPLVLWGLHRLWTQQPATTTRRSFVVLTLVIALALAAQVLSEFYLAVYLALALALFFVWQLLVRRWGLSWRGMGWLVGSGLLGLALCLPVVVPTFRAWSALDLQRPFSDHEALGARLRNYAVPGQELPLSDWLKPIGGDSAESNGAELSLYPGVLALGLALCGVFAARRRGLRDAPLYLLLALVAFYLSLGPTIRLDDQSGGVGSPFYRWLYDYLPGFQGARVPARWALLLQLALAVLAGYSVAALVTIRRERWWPLVVGLPVLALLLFEFSGTGGYGAHPMDQPQPEVYAELAARPSGAVLEYPLVNANPNMAYRYEYASIFHWRPLVNSGSSIVPQAYIEFRDLLGTFPSPRATALLQALQVRYVIAHRYDMTGWEEWRARLDATSGVRVLVETQDRQDLLIEVDAASPTDLSAERGFGDQVLLASSAPQVLDRQHVYERWRESGLLVERRDGSTVTLSVRLPTYLLGGVVALDLSGLPDDAVALLLTRDGAPVRVPLAERPTVKVVADVPQFSGTIPSGDIDTSGGVLPCRVYGQGKTDVSGLVLSVNLVDANGQVLAKQDRFFDEGFAAPDHWGEQPEQVPCDLALPMGLPAGDYTIEIGLFDPASGGFLTIADPEGNLGPWWKRAITLH